MYALDEAWNARDWDTFRFARASAAWAQRRRTVSELKPDPE
jgi:uncharacterized protein YjiS (DUF1127 family)